ncbi:HPF/RaiA family ribosome-associated protein [Candidatus Levibacter sp. Uisw_134_01]|uniref:ribosome hibernation promotion factor n=1 Tax=Candidatus Levibacter sp. Uisw_134_01 TaxID=3230999 RepID=UPI003D455D2C
MNFKIFGKQVKVGETFSRYVETSLKQTIHKYFENPISSIVSVSKKNKLFYIIVIVHINKKMEFTAQSNGQTAKLAFNETIEKISKQLRRYKRKLKSFKNNENLEKLSSLEAHFQIIKEPQLINPKQDNPIDNEPMIFAELNTEVEELSVNDALNKMKLGNISALMFRNKKHSGLNMIYKRDDGLIGWVDPRGLRNTAKI